MGKDKEAPASAKEEIAAVKGMRGVALPFWLFGLSGMAALIYEVVWTRALSLVLGSTTYALSTMLASFMAGLSIGAVLGGRLADRSKRLTLLFAALEAGIAVSALLVMPLISSLQPLYAKVFYSLYQSFSSFSVAQFFICFTVMLVPTTLMGATFPVVCRLNFVDSGNIGKDTGGVYAVNTVGAIIGALLAGFVLIPGIGVRHSNNIAAFINMSVALVLSLVYIPGDERKKRVLKGGGLFLVVLLLSNLLWIDRAYPTGFYVTWKFASNDDYSDYTSRRSRVFKKLFEKDSVQGNVRVYEVPEGKSIFINGRPESHEIGDRQNTALLAYLPASVNPNAASFLNIGLGTGNTVHYAATLPHLKEIVSVEINPAVEEAVRLFFYPELFKDERMRLVTADARNYLRVVEDKYDIISSEPSYPVDQGFSHLFSKEFFELVRSRLNEKGVACQWVPTYLFNEDQMAMVLKTFTAVFPNTTVWGVEDKEVLFIGSVGSEPQPIDAMKLRVDAWLRERGINPGYSLYVKTAEIEAATIGYTGPLNTDDMPVLEFYAARNMVSIAKKPADR